MKVSLSYTVGESTTGRTRTLPTSDTPKLWANSGDSHYMEPPDLYQKLPEHLRERMPQTVRHEDHGVEVITVDGQSFERPIPKPRTAEQLMATMARPAEDDLDEVEGQARARGAFDPELRLKDLDKEGIWGEAIYPSLGTWTFNIRTPEIVREGCRISNDFFIEFQRKSPRYVVAASIPLLDVNDTVAEIKRAAALGFKLGFFPVRPPQVMPQWQDQEWDPVWEAMEQNGLVVGFHIGTEPVDPTGRIGIYYRGRGGAVLN